MPSQVVNRSGYLVDLNDGDAVEQGRKAGQRSTLSLRADINKVVGRMIQTNPHGLPMPPRSTALLVAAVVACAWAAGLFAMDFVAAAVVVGGVAVVCAVLGFTKRNQTHPPN